MRWVMQRVRAMGLREILFRVWRWLSQRVERQRIVRGWAPAPAHGVKTKTPLFPIVSQFKDAWSKRYTLDVATLDRMLEGQIDLFGNLSVTFPALPDWHREPTTVRRCPLVYGKDLNYRNPTLVGNVKVVWELGRQHHLVAVAVAYALTGDPRYRQYIATQIESWIDQNPFGIGIHWCSALEAALRLVSWSLVHSLIAARDGDDGLFGVVEKRHRLGEAIYQQAWFVRHFLSFYSSANNHLFGELTGLWVACQVFDFGLSGERWEEYARRGLEREIIQQVFPDGVNKEQAVYYQLWVLEYALFALVVAKRVGRPFTNLFSERVAAMARFLRDVMPPGGNPPSIGDADDGFVARFSASWPTQPYASVLAAEALVDGGPCSGFLPEKAYWYGLIAGVYGPNLISTTAQASARSYPRLYADGGYAILGARPIHLVFDAGSLGYPSIAAHGHADALSFCLALEEKWWIVDPGTYAYHTEPRWRNYFRGSSAHNTIVVDGQDQSTSGGPFLWVRHANAKLTSCGSTEQGAQWAEGCHNGYAQRGIMHHRKIELFPNAMDVLIHDELKGQGRHHLAIYFHFAPDVNVIQNDTTSWILDCANSPHRMTLNVSAEWDWEALKGAESPICGWFSQSLGSKRPAVTLRGVKNGVLPIEIQSRIYIQMP